MKKSILLSLLFGAGVYASAADIVLVAANTTTDSTKENPFVFSSTIKNQPWTGGVLPTSSDRIIWGGKATSGNRTSIADGYVLVDGSYSVTGMCTSGTGGKNSTLHMLFDDASATDGSSSLTIGSLALSWNGAAYANTYAFEGLNDSSTGTLNFTTSQSFDFKATETTSIRKIVFGKGLTVNMNNANQRLSLVGTGDSTSANLEVNGTLLVGDASKAGTYTTALAMNNGANVVVGSTGKLVANGILSLGSTTSQRNTAANITFNSSGNEINGYVYMAQATSLYVNASNNFDAVLLARGSDLLVSVSAGTTEFNSLLVAEMTATRVLYLNIADGAMLKLDSLTGGYNNGEKNFSGFGQNSDFAIYQKIVFRDFGEGRVFVKDITGADGFLATLSISGARKFIFLLKI